MEVVDRTLKEIEWITGLSPTHYKNICRGDLNSDLEHMRLPLWKPFSGQDKKGFKGLNSYQVAFADLVVFTVIQALWFSKRSLVRAVVDLLKIVAERSDNPLLVKFKKDRTHIIELNFFKRDKSEEMIEFNKTNSSLVSFRYLINNRSIIHRLILLNRTDYTIIKLELNLRKAKVLTSMRFNLNELHELVKSRL